MKKYICLFTTSVLLASTVSFAENGFYGGLGAGGGRVEFDLAENAVLPPSGDTIDTSSFGDGMFAFKVFGGYRIFDYLAAEAAYVDLGEAETTACFLNSENGCAPEPGVFGPQLRNEGNPWTIDSPIDGWTLELVGLLPIGERFELFAKAGVFFWEQEITAKDDVVTAPGRPILGGPPENLIRISRDDNDLTWGFGGNFQATDKLGLRLEFQWFDIADTDSVWASTISAVYSF